jgi:hypothetical protein
MHDLTVTTCNRPDLEDILASRERLLWSGQPSYGCRFFQSVGHEWVYHIGFLIGAAVMWSSLPFIEPEARLGLNTAVWVYGALTIAFVAMSASLASQRQYVLYNLVYIVTDRRAIVCRRGRNWRFGVRLYIVSCPHSGTYPYSVISSRPYPSLQVGTMLSEDQMQPFGLGLSHPGHPILWGRITAPVMFDYVPNAQELLEMIHSHTHTTSAQAD